ncbi:MAG TPA: GNAT family N-acetyltransferase [Verrucomicrobiae bacterium]
MSQPAKAVGLTGLPVQLRPETAADEALLLALYTTTREEELNLTNWDAATRALFVQQQFQAMRRGYADMFPQGEFSILEEAGQPIGRIVVNRTPEELRLVDLVLTPERRGQGLGTRIIQALQGEAQQTGRPFRLHVYQFNRAGRLYERLGFIVIADNGLYREMTWPAKTP